jgi:nicotinate-nucleotide adenylyltransferase
MNIGLFFGSFNPVHHGHLIIASHLSIFAGLDEIWMVVSPQNPFKKSSTLLNQFHRLYLVQLATEGEKKIKASNAEFSLPQPSYTIDTLTYLTEQYPKYRFHIIMGSDSFQNIEKWKNGNIILQNYPIIIYRRPGFDIRDITGFDIRVADAPLLEISSTRIRDMVREGHSIRYLVPESVKQEIEKSGYYRAISEKPTKGQTE